MSDNGTSRTPFVCPRCDKQSWHPEDKAQGYCNACHDWTGEHIKIVLRFDSDVRWYLIRDLRYAAGSLPENDVHRALVEDVAAQIEGLMPAPTLTESLDAP